MFVFKLFTINNILFYISYFILVILLLFLSYKYLYLEQSNYVMSSRLNKLELEFNSGNRPITNTPVSNYYNEKINSAEMMMNEIYNDFPQKCGIDGVCTSEIHVTVLDEKPINKEIFDLKKEIIEDNASVISSHVPSSDTTRKSLMKLSLEKIKAKCEERKLTCDGSKSQLVDKIINYDNSKVVEDEIIVSDE